MLKMMKIKFNLTFQNSFPDDADLTNAPAYSSTVNKSYYKPLEAVKGACRPFQWRTTLSNGRFVSRRHYQSFKRLVPFIIHSFLFPLRAIFIIKAPRLIYDP